MPANNYNNYIEAWLLQQCTTAAAQGCAEGTGLYQIHQQVFGHKKNIKKADAARDLADFYAEARNITDIWNGNAGGIVPSEGLNEAEKAFVSVIFQYNGKEFKPTSKKIAADFGLEFKKEERGYYSYSSRDPFDNDYNYGNFYLAFLHLLKQYYPNTKTVLFFPGGKEMPPFVIEALKAVIPPFEYNYSGFEPGKKDYCVRRENRIDDFAAVVRFAGSEQLKVKQYTFDITKAKLAKMAEVIGFEEVCDNGGIFCTPRQADRINDFKVALPLFVLSANIGLLDIDKTGVVKPSENSIELLANPPHLFAKKLFEAYTKKNKIYETHYITYISVRDGEAWIDWEKCRKSVIELLKTCPVSKWVKFDEFEKYMAIFDGNFFRKLLNCAVFIQGFNSGYSYYGGQTPDWDECDAQIIRLILSFLGAMGILDIAYTEKIRRFKEVKNDFCVGISGFRITPLGAWILGLTDNYEASDTRALQAEEGGLIVQPDHTVVISGLKSRIEHESYLSGFLTKISSEDNVSVYRADFQSMVRAFNNGIQPIEIKSYLEKSSSRPLSENVARSFDGWQLKIGKVKIRTVTLLETDDALLLEELIHANGMGALLSGKITHAAIIADNKNHARVKSIAEKNGWLVETSPNMNKRGKKHSK